MNFLDKRQVLNCGRFKVQLGDRTKVMGILNVTPDSFSDGGFYFQKEKAIDYAFQMEAEGADIIDLGGESSRPGAQAVTVREELLRLLPILDAIIPKLKIPVSVDTYKTEVAKQVIESGASIINDIFALREPGMMELIAKKGVPTVLMHMKGTPVTMQTEPVYQSVIEEISSFFKDRIQTALSAGIKLEQIIIDPGIGFGKTVLHNLEILRSLDQFQLFNCPVLIGTSNKSFIGKILNLSVENRLAGSLATVAWAIWKGVQIVRVHNVRATQDVIRMINAIHSE